MLMRAVRDHNATRLFTFIGSDGWGGREVVTEDAEEAVLGTISVQPIAKGMPAFERYFSGLRIKHNELNPWFYEMWEKEHGCRFADSDRYPWTPYNQRYTTPCYGNETKDYVFEKQLQFVSDAVMVLTLAIKRYIIEGCQSIKDAFNKEQCMIARYKGTAGKSAVNGTRVIEIMPNITFIGLAGNEFHFDGNGAPPRYNLIHFRNSSNGYAWVTVGNYSENGLSLDEAELNFHVKGTDPGTHPLSVCSKKCGPGAKRFHPDGMNKKCCWICIPCKGREYKADPVTCRECEDGSSPDALHTRCIRAPIETVDMLSAYAIASLIVALIGVLITVTILVIFVRHNDTPIVKASGRELSYVIILGLLLCFVMTPLMLQVPTTLICGLQRFMSGFCFTIIYAGLLTKANRIARIFRSGKRTTRRPNFISPQSQIVICCLITSVQIVICAFWLYLRPPQVLLRHPTPERTQKVCQQAVQDSYLITYIHPIFLCVICTMYAIQTRHIPEAFNESKYIGVAVYTTCVIWLAFVPIYFVVRENIPIRITSVCISTSLTAVVCQVCLFFPKLYIIIFRPERNVRQAVMGPKSSSVTNKSTTYMTNYRSESSSAQSDENLLEPLTKTDKTATVAVQTSPVGKHAPLAYINSLNDGDVQL